MIMKAQVQYYDFVGTAAADISDYSDLQRKYQFLEKLMLQDMRHQEQVVTLDITIISQLQ